MIEKKIVKDKTITIKVTSKEFQKIEALVRKTGVVKSSLVRELVKLGYEVETKKKL